MDEAISRDQGEINNGSIAPNLKDGKEYEKQVLSQENYDSRTLYSRRGEIQDRNGQLLAYSEKVYRLVIDCKEINNTTEVTKKDDAVNATIEVLSEQFDLDSAAIDPVEGCGQTSGDF